MKKAQTVLEYTLIFILVSVMIIAVTTRFDIRNARNFSIFGQTDENSSTTLVIPAMSD